MTPNDIITRVCASIDVHPSELTAKTKTYRAREAKHICMRLIHQELKLSYSKIGALFGNTSNCTYNAIKLSKMTTSQIFALSPITDRWGGNKTPTFKTKEDIIRHVCSFFDVPFSKLQHKTRKREIVYARQACMVMLKQHTNLSLKAIGELFGDRDHTTVIHSRDTILDLMETDRKTYRELRKLGIRFEVRRKSLLPEIGTLEAEPEVLIKPAPMQLVTPARPKAEYSNSTPYGVARAI